MKPAQFITLVTTSFIASHALGEDIFVDINVIGGSENGKDWKNAIPLLQDGLRARLDPGDTVYIAQGVYYPDEGANESNDNQSESFQIPSGVTLRGGFKTGGDDYDPELYPTILSGDFDQTRDTDGDGIVDSPLIQGGSLRVVELSVLAQPPTFRDLIITGARTVGLFANATEATLEDCQFLRNSGRAASFVDNSNSPSRQVEVSSCLFEDNGLGQSSSGGGGLAVSGMDLMLDKCVFRNNKTGTSDGGGLSLFNGTSSTVNTAAVLKNSFFQGNRARNGGGISSTGRVALSLFNCVVSGNRAGNPNVGSSGGGIYQGQIPIINGGFAFGPLTLSNCTIAWNTAKTTGGGVRMVGSAPKLVANTLLFKNAINTSFFNVDSGISVVGTGATEPDYVSSYDMGYSPIPTTIPGTTNYNWDEVSFPTFVEDVTLSLENGSIYLPSTSGDLRLAAGSLLINGGNDSYSSEATDIIANPRKQGGAIDLGAYESSEIAPIEITDISTFAFGNNRFLSVQFTSSLPVDVYRSLDLQGYDPTPVATGISNVFQSGVTNSQEFFKLVPSGVSP